ncbi:spinster family MFS transporter [Polyangium jinanense]|uniref:MFS transporter n=1 Tax=Polyangium jinanense TaxID=2829994 RepID=A0A9X3WZA8_9BACT|nr:MFS transporter [Polyangium jinanense]MDC3953526.1 MFS transporter [Polyangium jinanense]MDC3979353.1 MFS transporter [Polyangium jinanense]
MIKSPRAILALLTALNLLNYVDRFVVTAVGPRIQEHLGLSDKELGLVTSAFMLGYFVTSPVFGWLGDRFPRKALIAAGVLVWSAATAASGLAGALASLLAARVVVGVGEASYATLSPTIIDDVAPAKKKNRWLGVFYVAIPAGSALGFILGGLLEQRYGWRNAFYIAGGPGVLLALVALLLHEPPRTLAQKKDDRGVVASFLDDTRALAQSRSYVLTVAGYIAQTFALGGFVQWAVPFLYRRLCLDLHVADGAFGKLTVLTGLVGTAIGSLVAERVPGEERVRAALWVCAISSAVATPVAVLALFARSSTSFLALLGVCELAVFASMAPTNLAILKSVPEDRRASAMALSIFLIHLLGDLISPPIVGAVSDAFGDSKAQCTSGTGLFWGMLTLPVALALSAAFWFVGARRKNPVPSPR